MTKVNSLISGKNASKKKSASLTKRESELAVAKTEELSESDLQAQIYSIAILLTGCADDAQQVVEEVMFALQLEPNDPNETYETKVHRLTYDSALLKLLNQVNTKSSKLEAATNKILNTNNYLA